jgi:hypothetical protein
MNLKSLILLLAIASLSCGTAEARRRSYSSFSSVPAGCSNKTAQGVAECCAKDGRLAHRGGNPSFEGLGLASTKEAAYRSCCYANSGMKTVDVGYAQMKNGQWVCCRRYGR